VQTILMINKTKTIILISSVRITLVKRNHIKREANNRISQLVLRNKVLLKELLIKPKS